MFTFLNIVRFISTHLLRRWLAKPLLALIIAFLCIASPVLAKIPADNSAVQQARIQELLQQGKILYGAGKFAVAVEVLQQAALTATATGDNLSAAIILGNLSLAFQQLGSWTEAEKAITQSLKLLNHLQIQNLQILAQTLDVQGRLQFAKGNAQAALSNWQRAAQIYQQVHEQDFLTRNRINSAQAMQALGLYRQANKMLGSVEQTLKNQPDSLTKALGLRSLGEVLQVVGNLKQSRRVLEQSLAVAFISSSNQAVSETLFSLGNTARTQQDIKAALNYYQQAISKSVDITTRIQPQLNQLSLLVEIKQYQLALALSSQILPELDKLPSSRIAVDARINLAQSLMKLGARDWRLGTREKFSPSPQPLVSSPSEVARDWRLGTREKFSPSPQPLVSSPSEVARDWRLGTREKFSPSPQPLVSSPSEVARDWRLGTREKFSPSPQPLVSSPSEVARDWRLGTREKFSPSPQPLVSSPSEVALILATAIKQAQSLQDKRAESYAVGTLGALYEKTAQLSDAQNLTEKALFIAQSINALDITYQWQWQLGRLRKQQHDIKGALAYYSEAFKTLQSLRSDLVAINPDIQFSFRESVEPVYRELVELLLQPPPNQGEINQENLKLARFVIESLQLAELDNFFRSACLDPQQGVDLLVDQKDQRAAVIYPIILPDRLEVILKLPNQDLRHYRSLITQDQVEGVVQNLREYLTDVTRTAQVKQQSQQIYDWLIRPLEKDLAQSGIKTLVFVLDGELRNVPMSVLYDFQQQKYLVEKYAIALTPGLQLIDPKPLQKVQLHALTAGVGKERLIENREFPPLENVARELKEIKFEIPKSKELLNQQFTEENLQNQLRSNPFSVVHLATHGEFSSNPEKTFIVTWDKLLEAKQLDNLLRVRHSTIELLVLSACKTAQGDKRATLGLAGVAVRAGARSTLATLWSVDDHFTASLMSEFYRELKAGVNKAQALQHAQLAVFAQEKSPYFWAPFVLLGNWL